MVKCLVESTIFWVIMLYSNVFLLIFPMNLCHKILEKILIVGLNVYFKLGKFWVDPMCA